MKVRSWRVTVFTTMALTFSVFVLFLLFTYIYFFRQTKAAVTQSYNQTLEICGETIEAKLAARDTHIKDLMRTVYSEKDMESDSDITRYKAYSNCLDAMSSKISFCPEIDELFILNAKCGKFLMQPPEQKCFMVGSRQALRGFLRGGAASATSIGDESWFVLELNETPYFYKAYRMGNYVIGGISRLSNYDPLLLRDDAGKSGAIVYCEGKAVYSVGRDWSGEPGLDSGLKSSWKGNVIFSSYAFRRLDGEIQLLAEENILNVMDKSEAFALLAMTVLGLLLFLMVSLRFRDMVYRPTGELMLAMKKIDGGNYEYRIQARPTSSEFLSLQNSFNKMADDLVNLKIESYEKQLQMKENQLMMLRAQIRPHFYVNALATVANMTYQNRNEDIRQYLKALADFMRYMLKLHSRTVKVSEELNNIRNYLKMQEIKFPDSVEAYIGCEASVEDRQIPYLILFTVIENAFKHAMDLYETLNIIIQCETVRTRDFDGFRIVVEDNGAGFPQEVLDRFSGGAPDEKGHIGLGNVYRTRSSCTAGTTCCAFPGRYRGARTLKYGYPAAERRRTDMKMLVADDDRSTIDMIESVIDWSELGIAQVLRAYNGAAAKQLIRQERPEIVLCDIGMPLCDGIQVLKWLRSEGIATEFIFLTCYSDFEYAREAIRYGASNYLTKPFETEELKTVVNAAVQKSRKERSSSLGAQDSSDRLYIINSMLDSLSAGNYGTDRAVIESLFSTVEPRLKPDTQIRLIYIQANAGEALSAGWKESLIKYALGHICIEALTGKLKYEYATLSGENSYITMLVFLAEQYEAEALRKKCEDLIALCRRYLSCTPVCLIGEPSALYRLPEIRPEMDKAIEKLRFQAGKIIFWTEYDWNASATPGNIDHKLVLEHLQQQNKAALMSLVAKTAEELASRNSADMDMHMLHQDLLQVFYSYMQDNNIQAHAVFRDPAAREMNEKAEQAVFSMVKLTSYMYDCIEEKLLKLREASGIAEKIKAYIEEHYREDISRADIAAYVYVTPNYLSKLFRQETGFTLREYINQCRIREAKRLMATTSMSVGDVALEVGFDNLSYFSTVFKKACGVSPAAWRG